MSARIEYLPGAEKYLRKLKEKPLKKKFLQAIAEIAEDPYAGDPKKGDLAGVYGKDFTYQGTTYEIAYTIDQDPDGTLVVIILAGTRENFYEQLKRYWN